MKISIAAITISLGLLTLPESVTSFSLSNQRILASSLTTKLHVTIDDVATAVAVDSTKPISTPSATKTSLRTQTKTKKKAQKAGEDIKFLVKRTNQIISHEPLSPSSKTDKSGEEQRITIQTFHWLMDAWAKSLHPAAPEHSLSLLNSMKEYGLSPTTKTMTKVILAYAKCGRGGQRAKEVMDNILEDFKDVEEIRPNAFSYTAVLEAFANANVRGVNDASMAEELMNLMINSTKEGDESMKPTAKSFLALLRVLGDCYQNGASKAEKYLKTMRKLVDDGTSDELPNAYHYNAILNAWANSGDDLRAERTEDLLLKMETGIDGVKPTTVSYNVCIDAYAKNGDGQKAEAVLNRMDEFYQTEENRECKPNTRSYNSVMNAYAKSTDMNASVKAETILRKMESLYQESDKTDRDIKPDFVSYSTAINAWGRSFEYSKAVKAFALYREMLTLYKDGDSSLRPNVIIFNSVMNACAYTIGDPPEQRQAMEIANIILKELEEASYAEADQITYGTFLKVCQTQMPQSDTRRQLVELIFKKCKKEGQMGQFVLDQMRAVATRTQIDEILGSYADIKDSADLPSDWTRNLVVGKRYRRQIFS